MGTDYLLEFVMFILKQFTACVFEARTLPYVSIVIAPQSDRK
jgi:uncharacterized membrane protein YoaT (DUF817 family)